jgi:hypothetical protein
VVGDGIVMACGVSSLGIQLVYGNTFVFFAVIPRSRRIGREVLGGIFRRRSKGVIDEKRARALGRA